MDSEPRRSTLLSLHDALPIFLLRQRVRERHGLVGRVAVYGIAIAVPCNEQVSLPGEREVSRRLRCAGLSDELEHPLRLRRTSTFLPFRISAVAVVPGRRPGACLRS